MTASNEQQGHRLIAMGLADRELVSAAWERLAGEPGADLAELFLRGGRITAEQAATVRQSASASGVVAAPTAAAVVAAPQPIPGYSIERELARGGMGRVLLATNSAGARCVIKMLLPEASTERGIARFEREAELLAAIKHPHIVPIHARGRTATGEPWLALPYVEGENLAECLERRGVEALTETVPAWFAGLASALAALHKAGLVHRDLKPENLMIESETDRPVLVDFGLAKRVESVGDSPERLDALTRTGEVIGTPAYMAPEQLVGATDPDQESARDIWAFGATLFTVLTGQPPFRADSFVSMAAAVSSRAAPRCSSIAPDIPSWLEAICTACLQRDPARRPTAAELTTTLESRGAVSLPRRGRSPLRPILIGLLALALVAGLGVAALLSRDAEAPKLIVQTSRDGATRESRVELKGRVEDAAPDHLLINGERAPLLSGGRFRRTLALTDGANSFRVQAVDRAGNRSKVITIERRLDRLPPDVEGLSVRWRDGRVELRGKLSEPDCRLRIGDVELALESSRLLTPLDPVLLDASGQIHLLDRAGNESTLELPVARVTTPSELIPARTRLPDSGLLLLGPGTYSAWRTLKRPLSVIGLGAPSEVVLQRKEGPFVRLDDGGAVRLESLTLVHESKNAAGDPAVELRAARAELFAVAIRSCGVAIRLTGKTDQPARLRLRQARIAAGSGRAIVADDSHLELDSVAIVEVRTLVNGRSAIRALRCPRVELDRLRFARVRAGALQLDRSLVLAADLAIDEASGTGVSLNTVAGHLVDTRIRDVTFSGIRAGQGTRIAASDLRIENAGKDRRALGVALKLEARSTIDLHDCVIGTENAGGLFARDRSLLHLTRVRCAKGSDPGRLILPFPSGLIIREHSRQSLRSLVEITTVKGRPFYPGSTHTLREGGHLRSVIAEGTAAAIARRWLKDPGSVSHFEAAACFALLAEPTPEELEVLARRAILGPLESTNPVTHQEALLTVLSARRLSPALLERLAGWFDRSRQAGHNLTLLAALLQQPTPKPLIKSLLEALNTANGVLALETFEALLRSADAPEVFQALKAWRVQDRAPLMQAAVELAIAEAARTGRLDRDRFRELMEAGEAPLGRIARLGLAGPLALPRLEQQADAAEASRRREVAMACGFLGPEALPILLKLADDPEPAVRRRALSSLKVLASRADSSSAEARAKILAALEESEPSVLETALRAAQELELEASRRQTARARLDATPEPPFR